MTVGTQGKISPLPVEVPGSPWDKVKDGALQCSSSSEEELLYLSFIEDITDEILKLGLFSNRCRPATKRETQKGISTM